jgi:uncharacterized protein DUF5681
MAKNPDIPSHSDSTQPAAGSNDSAYRIGYCHPPKHSQFQPGQSGNWSGRPKKCKTATDVVVDALNKRIRHHEEGTEIEMSKAEAAADTLVDAAVAGNMRAWGILISVWGRSSGDANESQDQLAAAEDTEILANLFDRELRRRTNASDANIDDSQTKSQQE